MKGNPYETRRYLEEYLLFHYGQPRELCPFKCIPGTLLRFHERIRKECLLPLSPGISSRRLSSSTFATRQGRVARLGPTRALDIGCAVGRFTFELGRLADHVIGLDNSAAFIRAARRIAKAKAITVQVKDSGNQCVKHRLKLPKSYYQASVEFQVGNALDLRELAAEPFQIVAAINLLCRLPAPRRFLRDLPHLVVPGGQLLLASPFSWLEEYTPKRDWLGPAEIRELLAPHFRLTDRRNLPFLIREHGRKYQLVISEIMVFRRS